MNSIYNKTDYHSSEKPPTSPTMNQDFFTNLPSHIIIDILSRLPILTILRCKCVCKPWLDLLESHEFIKLHLSKSPPGLAICQQDFSSEFYEIYEFEDDLHLDLDLDHDRHYSFVTNFKLPFRGLIIQGSANGLLLLRDLLLRPNGLFICNPVTGEYVEIHCPHEFNYTYPQVVSFGFGASRITGQHKVVRVFHDCTRDQDTFKLQGISKSECQVYTLGTGSWRSISPGAPFLYNCRSIGAFLHGNLHWLVFDLNDKPIISCFDLETEEFRAFSAPPPSNGRTLIDVFALGDNLSVCDNSSDDEIIIWLMKEYGDEKSWTKEFVISKTGEMCGECYDVVRPIKVFKDGDILISWGEFFPFYSSCKTRTITEINMFKGCSDAIDSNSILHTSSFLSLKSLGMENVSNF